jgi:Glu-tRNA(Gln) amidotransferase subunit E-like FAD-binding protein
LGGAGRMYPDTDSYPIVITETRVERIDDSLPELPEKREERYIKDFNLPEEIAKSLSISPKRTLFEEIVELGVEPVFAAVTIEQTIKALARDEVEVDNITDKRIKDIFAQLVENKIAKDAVEILLEYSAKNPQEKLTDAIEKLDLVMYAEEEVISIINKVLKANNKLIIESGKKAMGNLMGQVMEKVQGRYDGQEISNLVKKQLDTKLKEIAKKEE